MSWDEYVLIYSRVARGRVSQGPPASSNLEEDLEAPLHRLVAKCLFENGFVWL